MTLQKEERFCTNLKTYIDDFVVALPNGIHQHSRAALTLSIHIRSHSRQQLAHLQHRSNKPG